MSQDLKVERLLLIALSAILTSYGFIILGSAVLPIPYRSSLFVKQCMWLIIAVTACIVFSFINLKKLQPYCRWIGLITIAVLILVLIPGVSRCIKGAHRWIEFGGLRIQPSEPAKIGFILFFSDYLSSYMHELNDFFRGFLKPFCLAGCFCLLLILEPDFGTTALFGTVTAILLFVRGVKIKFIAPTLILAFSLFCVAIYLNPVRLHRIIAFLDLENNRLAGAYQLWQSLLAFSSGGWWGCGLGQGRQQFFFLPEAHTDFIGSILAEELGIIHMLILLGCFSLITYLGIRIIQKQGQPFLFFIGLGTTTFLTSQVFLNLGIITGLLPTKGLALPFLSYGGSNLVTNFCFIGLLINLTRPTYSPLHSLYTP